MGDNGRYGLYIHNVGTNMGYWDNGIMGDGYYNIMGYYYGIDQLDIHGLIMG